MQRYYYANDIPAFLTEAPDTILGQLVKNHEFNLEENQRNAWLRQIEYLKKSLSDIPGKIYFEFSIPRIGKRVDVLLITGNSIFIIEFKVGADKYHSGDLDQTTEYALDLKNFHEGSHTADIFPILVATKAPSQKHSLTRAIDGVWTLTKSNIQDLRKYIVEASAHAHGPAISIPTWESSGYKPTPTIVEAAQALYAGHNVSEISRSDAGATNLADTSAGIKKIIEESIAKKRKTICFVTGVPGAGKTLIGLDIASTFNDPKKNNYSVLLSGNGPLVEILQEALARDEVSRAKKAGATIKKEAARSKTKSMIQNIHHFRDEGLRSAPQPPPEKVVIFDEAQRAWTKNQTAKFMKSKKGIDDFGMSEPEFLISLLDRHKDWSVIICLVGGGQEINTGEAGISEWFSALETNFKHWHVCVADDNNTRDLENIKAFLSSYRGTTESVSNLHLKTSMRSFRSENVSSFVAALLDRDVDKARELYLTIKDKYPIELTRDLEYAKAWLKQKARGNERYGILASSGAGRLKASSLDVKRKIEPVYWFLNGKDDVRSSYFLEDVATEFHIQGLEIDWTCVAWDIDLLMSSKKPTRFRSFEGTKWNNINSPENKNYLLNKYRVLLTRARQGMIIYIPTGDSQDHTRPMEEYEELYQYLSSIFQ